MHLVAAEALAEAPDGKKRQRLAYRMVQRMEQRGKRTQRAKAVAERDDPHMLDAVIGEQALRVALKHDEPCGHQDRHAAEHDQKSVSEAVAERMLHRRHETHDAVERG